MMLDAIARGAFAKRGGDPHAHNDPGFTSSIDSTTTRHR